MTRDYRTRGRNGTNRRRRMAHGIGAIVLALAAASCSRGEEFVVAYAEPQPSRDGFTVCHGYGCSLRSKASLTPAAWQRVTVNLAGRPGSAAEERERLAAAIAQIERETGRQIGTSRDEPGASLFAKDRFQQDCIDEAVNTTTYLRLLDQAGLLRHHRIGPAAARGQFVDRWPHNTAVLVETASGRSYAIDSWFFANGVAPAVVPLETWKAGWTPPSA